MTTLIKNKKGLILQKCTNRAGNMFLIALILFCHTVNGQIKIIAEQPCFRLTGYFSYTIDIDSIEQIPTKHQFIVKEMIKKSMTDFQNNITFVTGQIIDVESLLTNDSILQTELEYIIPKYQLSFELTDTTIGVKEYYFEIELDQYGQLIKFEYPRENYNKRISFIDTETILKVAINYAKKKKYKTESYTSKIVYDRQFDKLCWHISFLQKSSGNVKNYKIIVIDAIDIKILWELDMESVTYFKL